MDPKANGAMENRTMQETWKKEFELYLMRRYPVPEALRASDVLLPAVFSDFRQMLGRAMPNEMVHEEYRTDDGKTVIHLYGKRIPQPAKSIFFNFFIDY